MKNGKIFNLVVTLILIPLWLDFVKEIIKGIPWVYYTVTGISTLLLLFYLGLTIHELRLKLDANFNYQSRKMDRLILGTRKKLQKIIARTGDSSIMNYALTSLREICPLETYENTLIGIAEKERNPEKKERLLIRANKSGGQS